MGYERATYLSLFLIRVWNTTSAISKRRVRSFRHRGIDADFGGRTTTCRVVHAAVDHGVSLRARRCTAASAAPPTHIRCRRARVVFISDNGPYLPVSSSTSYLYGWRMRLCVFRWPPRQ
ncbi:hypothetical protein DFH06DRAFT_560100 [Mycena polygramma]|nr:hypothetical protein DFH06DRAFT_560100 [Mycena polygramma]